MLGLIICLCTMAIAVWLASIAGTLSDIRDEIRKYNNKS